jgi:hypothetical protein
MVTIQSCQLFTELAILQIIGHNQIIAIIWPKLCFWIMHDKKDFSGTVQVISRLLINLCLLKASLSSESLSF